ncbi:hypothetical protein BDW59DRAFT_151352 [Aspergillus cavernicola]|uniref:Cupin type-2 domain-containing protein n=1 Tax=Aspergillus cavernicola TaxID=176166 RepID=A0ABR4HVN9_9EURO
MSSATIPVSDIKVVKFGDTYQVEGRPREDFEIISVFHPSNLPGKQIIVGRISMDPNAASPPHTHGGAAVVAITIEGTVLNQMNDEEPIVRRKGEIWYEGPGCHHQRSENNTQEKVSFVAVLVVDDEVVEAGYQNIFVLDAEREA